jgi:hypothetical protein
MKDACSSFHIAAIEQRQPPAFEGDEAQARRHTMLRYRTPGFERRVSLSRLHERHAAQELRMLSKPRRHAGSHRAL